ncbi:pilus assembly protein CpaB [Nocardioides anomalus]|uniref:Pilus assembly protein CpaB n=1 Tax=Nocardioides anomalus TaxID=2712223 RepID=A0A6G6W803_9ACTN|nr:SAF domain-containing protein [Nocardioides anomalus]QIG41471.1 pilus assembly protein CpaB [Nocardioides anomalus]
MPTRLPRLRGSARRLRRLVLRRRRLLAALCALLAVWAGLRATAAPAPPSVAVTVAAHDLGAGTRLRPGDLTTVRLAPGTAPDGRVRDPTGHTLAGPLRRGQPVTDTALLGPALLRDRPDLVALPVRLPDTAMADLLRRGDSVDLVAADPQGGPATTVAREALVLALPPPPADAAADGLPGRLVLLGVRPVDVGPVSSASVTRFLTVAWSG